MARHTSRCVRNLMQCTAVQCSAMQLAGIAKRVSRCLTQALLREEPHPPHITRTVTEHLELPQNLTAPIKHHRHRIARCCAAALCRTATAAMPLCTATATAAAAAGTAV
eukprot:11027619-Alexandrium_andersonii.AAC.1